MTLEEYQRRLVQIFSRSAASDDPQAKSRNERDRFDLRLDFKLGERFSRESRDALWVAQQRIDKTRELQLLLGVLTRPWDPAHLMIRQQVRGFSKILSQKELAVLLDLTEDKLQKFL